MKRYLTIWRTYPHILLLLLFLLHTPDVLHAADIYASSAPDCRVDIGPCSKKSGGAHLVLDIGPKPLKAMKELIFIVTITGMKEQENIKLKLQMPGMFMGNNEVRLVGIGGGKYTGTGVVPKCHSNKRLWSAVVEVPGLPSSETSFLFNVLY